MSKVITTYRVDIEVKKDLRKLTVNEEMDNVSDMLRTLIDFYKQSRVQDELPVIQTKEKVENVE